MCLREMKAAIVLMFFASTGLAADYLYYCPEPSTILPCSCEDREYDAKVTCRNVNDFGSIKELLHGKFDESMSLNLINLKDKTLERGAALEVLVFSFNIVDSPVVESLASDSLMDMNEIKNLEITKTSLTSIPTAAVAKLYRLLDFKCTHSKITRLLKNDFHGFPRNLEHLYLMNNPISSIEEGAFTGLSSLFGISLKGCHLKTLPTGLFSSLISTALSFADNEISNISLNVFSGLSGSKINLTGNRIRKFPNEDEMVKFLHKGNKVYLTGNPFQCSCDLKWILKHRDLRSSSWGSCRGDGSRTYKWLYELTAADFSDCNSTTL